MSVITSNAYNFSDFISSGVDARTGSFSLQINLGTFIGMGGAGLQIPLVIHFDASNHLNTGFGRGWSLPLSEFDADHNRLKLSTGQSFQIVWNDAKQEYDIPYRKLKDIRVFYLGDESEIKIVYKGGKEEYLDYETGVIKRALSPQGIPVYFEFEYHQNKLRLHEIHDEIRRVRINWWSNDYETLIEHSQSDEPFIAFRLHFNGDDRALTAFSIDGFNERLALEYQYFQEVNYACLSVITHPSGLREEIIYRHSQRLPNGAPIRYIPCVYRHLRYAGELQENYEAVYQFSDKNYLGFGSDRFWRPDEDTLFKTAYDYQYWSEELVNNKIKIKRTYNKYHLLIVEESFDENVIFQKNENQYYADPNLSIEYQSPQYSLLKYQSITYYYNNEQKVSRLYFDYDEYANLLKKINADGSALINIYYPLAGERNACPPEPFGMISLLKSQTFTPAAKKRQTPRSFFYTYTKLNRLQGEGYFVLLEEEKYSTGLSRLAYHQDTNKPIIYGRIKTNFSFYNLAPISENHYSYSQQGMLLIENRRFVVFDPNGNFTIKEQDKIDYKYDHIVESTDQNGNIERISYDGLGRIVKTTSFVDTPYEATAHIEYVCTAADYYVLETDHRGNQVKSVFNQAGKQIYDLIKPLDESDFKEIARYKYDVFGMKIEQSSADWLGETRLYQLLTRYEYDAYGEVKKIQHADGRIEHIIQNPVALTSEYRLEGCFSTTTYFNESGWEIKKETYSLEGQLLAKSENQYDGFGNLLKVIDTLGNEIDFRYDNLDRLINVTRFVEGVPINEHYFYPDFTEKEVIARLEVNGHVMGERFYDRLLRITEERVNEVVTQHTYDGTSERILTTKKTSQSATPDVIRFTYAPVIFLPLTRVTSPSQQIDASFSYHPTKGDLIQSLNPYAKNKYEYNSTGYVIRERIELNSGEKRVNTSAYSLQGVLLNSTDVLGNKRQTHLDAYGRPSLISEVIDGVISTTAIEYDDLSRPYRYQVTTDANQSEIELRFNAIGAEINRIVRLNGREVFSISQKYNQSMLMSERIYTEYKDTGAHESTTESYEYDEINRLVLYRCQGVNCPSDEAGNLLSEQGFRHDAYGNIIQVVNTFTNGETNTRTFSYMADNPVKLESIENTHQSYPARVECSYDFAGNLINDEQGRYYQYNALGKLDTVYSNAQKQEFLTSYSYDGQGTLVAQKNQQQESTYFYYLQNKLNNEIADSASASYSSFAPGLSGRYLKQGNANYCHQFLLGNAQKSTLQTVSFSNNALKTVEKNRYTPYGVATRQVEMV